MCFICPDFTFIHVSAQRERVYFELSWMSFFFVSWFVNKHLVGLSQSTAFSLSSSPSPNCEIILLPQPYTVVSVQSLPRNPRGNTKVHFNGVWSFLGSAALGNSMCNYDALAAKALSPALRRAKITQSLLQRWIGIKITRPDGVRVPTILFSPFPPSGGAAMCLSILNGSADVNNCQSVSNGS